MAEMARLRMTIRIAQLMRYSDSCPEAQDAVVKHALSHRMLSAELQRIADMMSPAVFGHDLSIRFHVLLISSIWQQGCYPNLIVAAVARSLSAGDVFANKYSLMGL
ncbi:hypothetical protein [Rhizobium sp. L43]|uniref:hypothetical protein n=1 Tax=Rhizobium sp. L43 TaxID=2035452 RepID=UPI000BEB7916|nr:hypothetical protein [Rhizobium sp. L43]PDS75696.1 hypothetical protein CO667_25770 [Rhizobium sp. L43]